MTNQLMFSLFLNYYFCLL